MTDGAWPNLTSKTLTDQVYTVLRNRILAGTWEPGTFIREQEISEKLGVSRTPVREALARLATERFVERIPHRGFRIPEKTADDLLELYPILGILEVLAAEKALPRLTDDDIARLRGINDEYAAACERTDVQAGITANNRFHHALSEGCGNKRLCRMLDELRDEVNRLEIWAFSRMRNWKKSLEEHEEILRAVEDGDHERALATLKQNRLMTYTDFRERLGSQIPAGDIESLEAEAVNIQAPGTDDDES